MEQNTVKQLTKRQNEIATLVAEGYCNKEIASELQVSVQTVKNILGGIFRHFGCSTRLMLAVRLLSMEKDQDGLFI